jgi:5-methylcytosine-specific restriction endonuclease McrA
MARRNFPKSVMVARIKAATVDGKIFCENCGVLCKNFQIDHIIPDGLTGEPTFENSKLLCLECHGAKTKNDVKSIAKAKRVEAKHLGVKQSKQKINSRGFVKKVKPVKLDLPPRRGLYE